MNPFKLTQDVAIDLGTANTIIIINGQIKYNAPSIVALDTRDGKLIAVGHQAQLMEGKTPDTIKTVRPLRDGVIADFNAAEQMIRGMIKLAMNKRTLFSPQLRMVVGVDYVSS